MTTIAASTPACKKIAIAGDLLVINAGWRCESTKHRYIKHGLGERFFSEFSVCDIRIYTYHYDILFFPVFVGDCLIGIRFSLLLTL